MTKLSALFAALFLVYGIHGHGTSMANCNKALDTIQKVATLSRNQACGQYKNDNHGFMAFAASLSKDYKASGDRKVVFDQIETDIGNHYKDGVFTAPTDGVYFFAWTITTVHGGNGDSELMVNNIIKRRNACDSKSNGSFGYKSGSASIVLQLKKEEKVWIRFQKDGYIAYGGNWSSFQGWLLKHM